MTGHADTLADQVGNGLGFTGPAGEDNQHFSHDTFSLAAYAMQAASRQINR
jgi:hypothetical protein